MGKYTKRLGLGAEGVVVAVRPVKLVCVSSRKYVIRVRTSKTAHGYRSTLENAVQVAVHELFDSNVGLMTRH